MPRPITAAVGADVKIVTLMATILPFPTRVEATPVHSNKFLTTSMKGPGNRRRESTILLLFSQ